MSKENKICIIVASHISREDRIPHLISCLRSLLNQTVLCDVYLSISFQTEEIKEKALEMVDEFKQNKSLILKIHNEKTAQMKHIGFVVQEVLETHDWVMFCDDDDTYEPNRCEKFLPLLNDHVTGVFESWVNLSHQQYRYEFWTYCIRPSILMPFFEGLKDHPDILHQSCCDIMFVEYMRRLDPILYHFERLDIPDSHHLYYYRKENNENSITDTITKHQPNIRVGNPPEITDVRFAEYIIEWNEYIKQNLHIYMHDVYLRTVVGCEFDYIMQKEFHVDYKYLCFVDSILIETLRNYHNKVREICEKIYGGKL
jgi:glycosyltransferase involved in cell wall biosynthesis